MELKKTEGSVEKRETQVSEPASINNIAGKTIVKRGETATIPSQCATGRCYRIVKRCFDFVSSLALSMVILLPVLVLMVLIMIKDPGNPLYFQKRVGKGGRTIYVANLRWMKTIDNSHRECTARRPVSCATRIIQKPERGFRHQSGHFKPAAAAESGAFRRPSEQAPIHRTA